MSYQEMMFELAELRAQNREMREKISEVHAGLDILKTELGIDDFASLSTSDAIKVLSKINRLKDPDVSQKLKGMQPAIDQLAKYSK